MPLALSGVGEGGGAGDDDEDDRRFLMRARAMAGCFVTSNVQSNGRERERDGSKELFILFACHVLWD